MIEQVSMMVTIKTDPYEAQFIANGHAASVERHQRRMDAFKAEVADAEKLMDDLLNDGYTIVAQYQAETNQHTTTVFILHKPDKAT